MKTAALLAAASVLLASSLLSGLMVPSVSAQARTQDSVLPPPAMHDPGARAVAPAPVASVRSPAASRSVLPSMQDAGAARGRDELPPEVSVHQSGNDSVQEYRRNGQLYMVVVTPRTGIAQTYMVDPQGRLVDEHGQKPVRPVMYKVLEWGKSKPAAAATSARPVDGGH